MVQIENKQILINGVPTLIMCGEIHYYRLQKKEWEGCIHALKRCGANAVATYIPWICHELEEGAIDLTGQTREQLNLKAFFELCEKNDLYIIARPGPFIMAEMKNEGIPFWVYEKYPDAIPIAWDDQPATTKTLDYLHPGYLTCVKSWYSAVMTLIRTHLIQHGGKIIAVQLDNEVGMLSWVSNAPVLTDHTIGLFEQWLEQHHQQTLAMRYGDGFNLRAPNEQCILTYHKDLGYFMRDYISRYFDVLRSMAISVGVTDVPFLINIHGTEAGRAYSYCIGLSQLYQSFHQDDGFISGSDHYLGEVDIGNFQDYYMLNCFTDCCNSKHQPLTSIEFEVGDGDYQFSSDRRVSPYSQNIKTRMFIAQGNRLINYYLFSGGENYRVTPSWNDGNDRIASTGQKHGFSAPIDHNGHPTSSFDMLCQVTHTIMTNASALATMTPEYDNLVFCFVPDYYMTEYCYPKSETEKTMIERIKRIRNGGCFNVLAKSLLLTNHQFPGFNIQDHDLSDLAVGTVVMICSTLYLCSDIQQSIVNFLKDGGHAFIYGELPLYDMEGHSCTILCDYLGVTNLSTTLNKPHHYLSVYPCGFADGQPEVPVSYAQTMEVSDADVFLRVYEDDGICGFIKDVGKGRVVCLTSYYHNNLSVMKALFEKLQIQSKWSHDFEYHGIWIASTKNAAQERFVHIINLDDRKKTGTIYENGQPVFSNLYLDRKGALMLPCHVMVLPDVCVSYSTAEIYDKTSSRITFRLTQMTDRICIQTDRQIAVEADATVKQQIKITRQGDLTTLEIYSRMFLDDLITIVLNELESDRHMIQ